MTFKYDCTGSSGRDKPKRLGKNSIRNFIFLNSGFVSFHLSYLYVSSIYFIDSTVVIRKPQIIQKMSMSRHLIYDFSTTSNFL